MVGESVGTCHLHCYLGVILYSILVIGLDGVSFTYGSLSLCLRIDCSVAPLPDYDHLYQVLSVCVRENIYTYKLCCKLPLFLSLSLSLSLLCYSNCNCTCDTQFMQVGIDVKYMHTNFCGWGLFGFRDIATFPNWPKFSFGPWAIIHGSEKI